MKTILLAGCLVIVMSCGPDAGPIFPTPDDELTGPISKPSTGYGADGTFTVAKNQLRSAEFPGRNVELFYPEEAQGPVPVLFFCHAFGGNQSDFYQGLLDFVAKKGYAIVFAPYPTRGVTIEERYDILWSSFLQVVESYPDIIDTSKAGFIGHSFGAGACFALAYRGFVKEGWGSEGRIIFAMAQWYSHELTPQQLDNFPDNTKVIIQVYDDDDINDHRMAIDIFRNINIEKGEKDFVQVSSSSVADYQYLADHGVPNTITAFDALDYYAIYRLLDALMDYSFNGVLAAKIVALGGGHPFQVRMPCSGLECMEDLIVTDDPIPGYPQNRYLYPCTDDRNPRMEFCRTIPDAE